MIGIKDNYETQVQNILMKYILYTIIEMKVGIILYCINYF